MPERVDFGTTACLFDRDAGEDVFRGRHFAGNGGNPSARRDANADVLVDLTDGHAPLIRYEWRNRAGETMVVEAAWPFDAPPSAEFAEPMVPRKPGYDYPNAS